jgi:hypothetical protein
MTSFSGLRHVTHPGMTKSFTIFVDAMFTSLREPRFTKAFDTADASPAGPCVVQRRNAD